MFRMRNKENNSYLEAWFIFTEYKQWSVKSVLIFTVAEVISDKTSVS